MPGIGANFGTLVLGDVPVSYLIAATVASGVAFLTVGILGVRLLTGQSLARAREEGRKIVESAQRDAETRRKEIELEAEKKAIERRERLESELNRTREELKEEERRLDKRQDTLDRKLDMLASKEKFLEDRAKIIERQEAEVTSRKVEAENLVRQQTDRLMSIAGITPEQARTMALERAEEQYKSEASAMAQKIITDTQEEAKNRGREIVLMAVQRYAGEYVAESTVRAVPIPSDDMKGRIIGREGRNIRALERATGVDILVDDTPGIIAVSCFDKVRQAIAGEALQKLVEDGRIHPTRIEEVVEQVRRDVEERIVKYGRDAANEAKIRGLHPKIIEAMGRLHFRTSYGQNVLKHSIEVAYLSQMIADQLGLDGTIARRCGFLHDIGKAMDHELEGGHPKIGMEFCKKLGEGEEVLNAVGGHHADIPSTTPYTPIVMAADAVSGARPGARRESMEQYIQRLEQLEGIARDKRGVTEAYAIQAGREVRVIVDADKVSDADAFGIAREIAKKVSEEMTFPGEIKVTVLRETRAVEYAT